MSAHRRIEEAFAVLESRQGFVRREAQAQLSLILSDLIEGRGSGMIEAPTGLGKSLAILIASLAQIQENKNRIAIATYTNVLAEQYWFKDLPIALSLFPEFEPNQVQFIIGRQRYVCRASLSSLAAEHAEVFDDSCRLGTDNEWRRYAQSQGKVKLPPWSQIGVPPVCQARLCPHYEPCYYYGARRRAAEAKLIITNHSVILTHMLARASSDVSEGLLGNLDYIALDEGHDFVQAAQNGLEHELSISALGAMRGVASRLESLLEPVAVKANEGKTWPLLHRQFRDKVEGWEKELGHLIQNASARGVFRLAPSELADHPAIKQIAAHDKGLAAESLVREVLDGLGQLIGEVEKSIARWMGVEPDAMKAVYEVARSYLSYLETYFLGLEHMIAPEGASVTYVGGDVAFPKVRLDTVDLSLPLREVVWEAAPAALISATLAIDSQFSFFHRTLGLNPDFEDILPSPFDFGTQASLYLPPSGRIPDPSQARDPDRQRQYYGAVAKELETLMRLIGGRTLALFHSRKEMDGVAAAISKDLPFRIYTQPISAAGFQGERFRQQETSCLFGLRTFWTGFDAPGPTLSHVAIVRIPFEVPIEPLSISRSVHLQSQGIDSFAEWTLAQAKLMIRQGFGRLIRTAEDRGVVSIIDPRIQTKPYGESILENLPLEIRRYSDFMEAMASVGLDIAP